MKPLQLLIFLAFLASCHKKTLPTQAITNPKALTSAPSILFLQIKVIQKEDSYEAKIINRQEVAGILDKTINNAQLFENQWLIRFFDKEKKLLEQVTVPNPLDEKFEVADDKGQFKSVEVKKKEAEFFFRVQSNPLFKTLQIEQILPSQQKKKLISINF